MDSIKHIFIDIDGTLINPRLEIIEDSTKETLKLLKEKGYHLFLATGRSRSALEPAKVLGLVDWDGYVLNNGQVIFDENFELIFQQSMDHDFIRKFIKDAQSRKQAVLLQGNRWIMATEPNDYVHSIHRSLNTTTPQQSDLRDNDEIFTMMLYGEDGSIANDYPELHFAQGHSPYFDIMMKGHNKATGIEKIQKRLGFTRYLAIGDSMNDLEMFQAAHHSLATYDAPQALKEVATHVSNELENEFKHLIEKLGLI